LYDRQGVDEQTEDVKYRQIFRDYFPIWIWRRHIEISYVFSSSLSCAAILWQKKILNFLT